jgi:hypothetical protein
MSITRIEDKRLDPIVLARLTKSGPVIVTHDGIPLYVIHPATPEWLEALDVEENKPGDMALDEYARLYDIPLNTESYMREFPEDAPYTTPSEDQGGPTRGE